MTDVESVRAHLAERMPEAGSVGGAARLSGGLINEVWRVEVGGTSVIVKHAPPHAASAPGVPLSPLRATFEARALRTAAALPALRALRLEIRPPLLLDFDADRATLILEDLGGAPDLEQLLLSGGRADRTAKRVGAFIGTLHRATMDDEHAAAQMDNRDVQESRLRIQYASVAGLLAGFGFPDARKIGAPVRALGERLLGPGTCLTMGDLWPRSVLVGSRSSYVIDWEFAHYGRPLQDVAHLAAHLVLLGHRHGGRVAEEARRAWVSFTGAYRTALGSRFDVLWQVAERDDAARHLASEILVRQVGPFVESDGMIGKGRRTPIVDYAARILRDVASVDVFDAAGWPIG